MKYLLLCPKGSMKGFKELIKRMDGFWNGIGYAFPIEVKPLVQAWLANHPHVALVEVPLEETWEEYKELCKEDWNFVQISELKLEKFCLETMEGTNE